MVGAFTISGTSIVNGERDIQIGAAATGSVTQQSFSGTFTAPSTNGRGTLTLASGGAGASFAYYAVNNNRIYLVQTDTGVQSALGGTAETQTGTNPAPGTYDFLLDHAATDANGSFEKAGRVILNNGGTLQPNTTEDDDLEDVRANITSGTYTAPDAHGRTVISGTTQKASGTAGSTSQVAYVVNPPAGGGGGRMYLMSTDVTHGQPGVGFANQASGSALFAPTVYNFELSELGESTKGGNITEIGQFRVSGATAIAGIVITNKAGTVSATPLSVTFPTAPLTGRQEVAASAIQSPGFGTAIGMIFYISGTEGGIMLGEQPDIDGRFYHQ
jgi:hypothetical protein